MSKILSHDELTSMRQNLVALEENIDEALNDCKTVLDAFSNEEIVNSFFRSGKYGASEKEKVEKVLNAITQFNNVIRTGDNNLCDETLYYIDKQLELVGSGTSSNSSSSSNSTSSNTGSTTSNVYGGAAGAAKTAADSLNYSNYVL